MSSLLPCLEDPLFIDLRVWTTMNAASHDVEPTHDIKPTLDVELPPPPPYVPRDRVTEYLELSEVEQILDSVEQRQLLDLDQCPDLPDLQQQQQEPEEMMDAPASPYFGRTSPMYDDHAVYRCWSDAMCSPPDGSGDALSIQIPNVVPDFNQLGTNIISPAKVEYKNDPDDVVQSAETFQVSPQVCPDVPASQLPPPDPTSAAPEPDVKRELRHKIQTRRRQSGLEEAVVEYKDQGPEVLTDKDVERRRRRRESNRRAATKSRIKKKIENQAFFENKTKLELDNERKQREIESLQAELANTRATIQKHLQHCPNPGHLRNLIDDNK